MRALVAELYKLATLPGMWIGAAVSFVLPVGITAYVQNIQARQYKTAPSADDGFQQLMIIGVVGAIIIGVLAISGEYASDDAESGGGRPLTTALTVRPQRVNLLMAQFVAVGIVVTLLAAVTTAATLTVKALPLEGGMSSLNSEDLARGLGVIVYWLLMSWLAQGITLLTRNSIIPLTILIVNSAALPLSYLLSKAVPMANYLPDRAGFSMVMRDQPTTLDLDPVVGGSVMVAWTLLLMFAGAVAFCRRDA